MKQPTNNSFSHYFQDANEALEDIINNRFIINTSTLKEEYSNVFCRVYQASDTQSSSSLKQEAEYLAYIFNSSMPFRTKAFDLLQNYPEEDIIKPLSFSKTFFSLTKSQHFTVITHKPSGTNLIDYISQNGPVSENFLSDLFIPSIIKIFQNLETIGLSHGSLSPSHIYINGENITFGECFSTAPGFNQITCYESLERMTALPLGKGEPDILTDFFSIGVICLFLITGQDPRNIMDKETMIKSRLALGSYQFFITHFNQFSNQVKELLKGLLSDKRGERWKISNLQDWINNVKYNVLNVADNSEASRNIIFNSKHYINYRALSYALGQEWEAAKIFLKEDTLIKWVETSLADTHKAEKLHYLLRNNQQFYHSSIEEKDENVAKTILILNPENPICFKDVAIHIEGISFLFAYAYSQGKKELIDSLIKIILYGLWKGSIINLGTNYRQEVIFVLENSISYINKKGLGFGIERFLYEICPNLACQSKFFDGHYIDNLEKMLTFLDFKAQEYNTEIMDLHIAGYIAAKLKINNHIKFNNQSEFAKFENNSELNELFLLSNAQKFSKSPFLPNLCKLVVKNLNSTLDLIYNRKTRAEIYNRLQDIKEKGDLTDIFRIITNYNFIINDQKGFNEACLQYNKSKHQLEVINQPEKIYEFGYKYGLKLSVILSYLVTLVTFIILLSQYLSHL